MANTSAGQFVWYENLTKDPKAAIEFYADVVGWKTEPFGDGSYTMWMGSQGPLGGVMQLPQEALDRGAPPRWSASVHVDSVDQSLERAKQLGATLIHGPEDIPGVGRHAVITDPQGAAIDLFQPASAMPAHDPETPGEFCWNELMTSDRAAGFAFYSELFGWKKFDEMDMGDMGTYLIYGTGERQLGGMMNAPKDAPMPPMWIYYVSTADLHAALARAQKRNAQVLHGPVDVPGGGRIVQLMDPQGAMFALHQGPAGA